MNKTKLSILEKGIVAQMTFKSVQQAARQFAEIECMLAMHGGDTNALLKKAKELARTTTMSFKEAAYKIIDEDRKTRIEPVGFLNKRNS